MLSRCLLPILILYHPPTIWANRLVDTGNFTLSTFFIPYKSSMFILHERLLPISCLPSSLFISPCCIQHLVKPMDPASVYLPPFFEILAYFSISSQSLGPSPQQKQTTFLSTEQPACWLILALVSEFQVPNSDHFRPFSAVKKGKRTSSELFT